MLEHDGIHSAESAYHPRTAPVVGTQDWIAQGAPLDAVLFGDVVSDPPVT